MAHTLRDSYSKLVDAKLRTTLVTKDNVIFNNRYDGEPTAGAVKIPVRDTEVTVGTYNKASGGSLSTGTTTYATLSIDKDYYVNELIDGYDAAAVPDNLIADRLDSAGYNMAKKVDSDCINLLETTASIKICDTKTALTKSTVVTNILAARTYLSNLGVPQDGRWLIISPEVAAFLFVADEFTKMMNISESMRVEGSIGKIYGFDVFESSNLMSGNTTLVSNKSTTTEFIAGHPNWCSRVTAWKKDVHVQDLSGSGTYIGASAVQGRLVWGAKITKPSTVYVKRAEVTVAG